jgi:hypothetical protein
MHCHHRTTSRCDVGSERNVGTDAKITRQDRVEPESGNGTTDECERQLVAGRPRPLSARMTSYGVVEHTLTCVLISARCLMFRKSIARPFIRSNMAGTKSTVVTRHENVVMEKKRAVIASSSQICSDAVGRCHCERANDERPPVPSYDIDVEMMTGGNAVSSPRQGRIIDCFHSHTGICG